MSRVEEFTDEELGQFMDLCARAAARYTKIGEEGNALFWANMTKLAELEWRSR